MKFVNKALALAIVGSASTMPAVIGQIFDGEGSMSMLMEEESMSYDYSMSMSSEALISSTAIPGTTTEAGVTSTTTEEATTSAATTEATDAAATTTAMLVKETGPGPDCPEEHVAYMSGSADYSVEQAVSASCEAGTFKDCYAGEEATREMMCADGFDPATIGLNSAAVQLQCAYYEMVFDCCDGVNSYDSCKSKIPYDGISMFGIKGDGTDTAVPATLPAVVTETEETTPPDTTSTTVAFVTDPTETAETTAAAADTTAAPETTAAAGTEPTETFGTTESAVLEEIVVDDMSMSMSISMSLDYESDDGSEEEPPSTASVKLVSIYSSVLLILAPFLFEL